MGRHAFHFKGWVIDSFGPSSRREETLLLLLPPVGCTPWTTTALGFELSSHLTDDPFDARRLQ